MWPFKKAVKADVVVGGSVVLTGATDMMNSDVRHEIKPDAAVEAVDSPWLRAGMAYNDTFLRLAAAAANWRLFAFICLGIAAIAVCGAIYIGSQSKFVPYLVEVDKLGRTVAVKALTGDEASVDPSRLVYRELFELVENLRTVTTDVGSNNRNLTNGFARLSGAANTYVRAEIMKAKPNDVGQTKTIQVVVKTALRLTDKTWQVEWEERSYGLNGEFMYAEKWKATVGYRLSPQGTEEAIRQNPVGFIVTDMSWQKVI